MIPAHEHVFFGDAHSGNLMVKISYTNDDVPFVPTWIDFIATVLRREVFLLQRYLREKGIPPHSIGIADGGVQGVDDAPGPFSLACSPLCWKSSLTATSCKVRSADVRAPLGSATAPLICVNAKAGRGCSEWACFDNTI